MSTHAGGIAGLCALSVSLPLSHLLLLFGHDVVIQVFGLLSRSGGLARGLRLRVRLEQGGKQKHKLHAHAQTQRANGGNRDDGLDVRHIELIELHHLFESATGVSFITSVRASSRGKGWRGVAAAVVVVCVWSREV